MVNYPNKIIMQVNIALLTVTDTRTIENDKSGEILVKKISDQKHNLIDRKIVKDDKKEIKKIILDWTKKDKIDVIITTGGTGLTGRDITPEVLEEIAEKKIPGFGELFRQLSYKTIGTSTLQSRACAILKNGKYIFALPGSSGGVTDAWDMILKYQLDINHKPCNFVELLPRLKEKYMKLNAVRAMLITSLIIIILYIMGLFLPIIKNTKESKFENFNNFEYIV